MGRHNTAKGQFRPKNPGKYNGKTPIIFRSSWEFAMMNTFDQHPNVLAWQSETISIPYFNPLTRRWSMYIPDFLVVYMDKTGKRYCEMLEVKPADEIPGYGGGRGKLSTHKQAVQSINYAKWAAAVGYCARRNWQFRVATAEEMFAFQRTVR